MGKSNEGNSLLSLLAWCQQQTLSSSDSTFHKIEWSSLQLSLPLSFIRFASQQTFLPNKLLKTALQEKPKKIIQIERQMMVDVYQIRHWAMKDFVDPSRPQESRIEEIWPRGRGQNENPPRKAFHAIQLSQELIDDSVGYTSAVMASSAKKQRLKIMLQKMDMCA